jgi:hypothetical protein
MIAGLGNHGSSEGQSLSKEVALAVRPDAVLMILQNEQRIDLRVR